MLSGLERRRWPTAIIAFNDLMALGAMKQLKNMGLRLPQDMAIIGCDNQFFCSYTDPALTTVDLHPEELGSSAVRELLTARDRAHVPFNLMRAATLIVRCLLYTSQHRLHPPWDQPFMPVVAMPSMK